MPKGVPLTDQEQMRRRHEIFGASVKLFLRHGFQETSLREIAEEAGIGKSTFYDYFENKDEILLWGVQDQLQDLTDEACRIAALPLPAAERLRRAMKNHAEYVLASREFFIKLSFEVQRLSLESQKRIQVARHEYQDTIRQIVDDGIREGTFRKVDALLAARLLIQAVTPTILTSRPTGTPQKMLDRALDILLKGIQA
jgi:AcrR family transcriptional regulator